MEAHHQALNKVRTTVINWEVCVRFELLYFGRGFVLGIDGEQDSIRAMYTTRHSTRCLCLVYWSFGGRGGWHDAE